MEFTDGKEKYRVDLILWKGKQIVDKDTKYILASTPQGAIRAARFLSMLPKRAHAIARIATPRDLECVPA